MMLTFDIETLPTDDAEIIAALEATISAPGQYKKPESIAEWMTANKETILKELVAKTSFDGIFGRVACIAWSEHSDEIDSSLENDSEGDAIERFYSGIGSEVTTFCGHNVHGFDLQFLKHRSIIIGIRPPKNILRAMNAKAWDDCIADTMLMWSPDREKRASLDKLCKAFGITGKDGFDGSMVADTWKTDPGKVIEYCKDDVRRAMAVYKRIVFA